MLFSEHHFYSSPTDLEAKDLRLSYSISCHHSWLMSYKVSHYLLVYDSRKPPSWLCTEDKAFRVRMDGTQGTLTYCLIWWVATLPTAGGLELRDLWGPFQLQPFCETTRTDIKMFRVFLCMFKFTNINKGDNCFRSVSHCDSWSS